MTDSTRPSLRTGNDTRILSCSLRHLPTGVPLLARLFTLTSLLPPTLLGIFALLFWSIDGVLVSGLHNIPSFEILAIIFSFGFILTAIKLTIEGQWSLVKQPWWIWIIGVFGVYGNNVFYVISFKYAPPQQVLLIYFLWPIFALVLTALVERERFQAHKVTALLIGLSAIAVLNMHHYQLHFETKYFTGYICALIDATLWSSYIVISKRFKRVPVEMIGMYFGVGAVISLVLHHNHENFVMPTLHQFGILVTMGIFTQCLAYFFWQIGIQRGNFSTLNTLSYSIPIFAVMWLILCGIAKPSVNLFLATALVTISVILASTAKHLSKRKRRETCNPQENNTLSSS
ncbi:MAG: DMT family transporter [Coxiellaceae bacterium]|nr:DMT family transporter [Coxiellaceae bacterium]